MKSSEFRHITDELLSAYLDNAVSEQERALVEAAVIAEPDIAWRLDSLRQTVQILRNLPELALPRSFMLQEAQLGETLVARRTTPRTPAKETTPATPSLWNGLVEGWRALWQAGNPLLRNAAAASFVLLLMLIGGTSLLATQPPSAQVASAPSSVVTEAEVTKAQTQPAQEGAIALASPVATATGTVEILAAADEQPAGEPAPVEQPVPQTDAARAAEQPAPKAAASAPAAQEFAPQENAAQADAIEGAGEAAIAQAAPASEAAPQGAEPLLTPVAPLPDDFIPSAPYAPGMGGDGGAAGSGGGPGMPGDVTAYPGDAEGGLLPPGAYDSGPDFVPAEPPGARTAQEAAPQTSEGAIAEDADEETTEEAAEIAMLPPDEPTATPASEDAAGEGDTESTGVTTTVATTTSYGVQVTGSGLLRMAQIGLGLITLMLMSLWWRSRGEPNDG